MQNVVEMEQYVVTNSYYLDMDKMYVVRTDT